MSEAEFDDDVTVDIDEASLARIRAEAARRAAGSGDDPGSGKTGEAPEGADEATRDIDEEVLESIRAAGYDDVPTVEGYGALREIGRGGFSRVYEALQFEFQRWVAIKVLNQTLEGGEEIGEFERECRLMGVLSRHPNIVTVFASAFTSDHRPCIAMELFPHGSYLHILQRTGPLALEDLLPLAVRISGALATAHRQGMVHADVKPQNIFQSEFEMVALGDFGIATLMHQRMEESKTRLSLYYAAPELIERGVSATSPFADQYSLGATIYTLATGRRPFQTDARDTTEQLLSRMLSEPPPRLGGEFPASLDDALYQAMAREPQDRHRDVVAFAAAIANVQQELGLRPTEIPITRDAGRYVGQTPGLGSPGSATRAQSQDSPTGPSRTGDTAPAAASGVTEVVSRTVVRPMTPTHVEPPTSEPEEPQKKPRVPHWAKIVAAVAAVLVALAIAWFATRGSGPSPDAVPEAPSDLVVQGRDGRLLARWDEPDDGGSDIVGYRVELYLDGAKQDEQELTSGDRESEFTELVNGVEYDVRVVAVNAVGESDIASEPGVPMAEETVPQPPRDLVVQGRDGRLMARWDEPDDGGSDIVGYRVELYLDGAKQDEQELTSGDRESEFTELVNGVEYDVRVVAVNAVGESDIASEPGVPMAEETVPQPPRETVPQPPRDLVVQGRDSRLLASWDEPDNGGSDIVGYRVELYLDGTKQDEEELLSDERIIEFVELTNGTEYEVRVVAVNAVGDSDLAHSLGVPTAEITVPARPSNVVVHEHFDRLEVTWDQPDDGGSPITGYRVELHSSYGLRTESTQETRFEFTDLAGGRDFEVYIFADNKAGPGEPAYAIGATLDRVAFVGRDSNGQSDIYYADFRIGDTFITVEQVEKVTATRENEGSPAWSPDGSWIAFHRSQEEGRDGNWQIWMRNIESGIENPLICGDSNGNSPHWSDDGRHVVFSRGSEGRDHLYQIDVITGEVEDVKLGNTSSRRPKFSPDKNHVAFMRGEYPTRSIRILNLHSNSRNVDTIFGSTTEDYSSPDWLDSSSSNRIAFGLKSTGSESTEARHIYSIDWQVDDPRGNDPDFVVSNLTWHTNAEYNDDEPSWSPDGRWIAFTRRLVDTSDGSDFGGIYVVSTQRLVSAVTSPEPIRLVVSGSKAPSWAPEPSGSPGVAPQYDCRST